MYTFKQMEAFYWSATLGSFRSAADHLHVTQSTIAKRIGELERFFGVPLFERAPKTLIPTRRGKALIGMAKKVLSLNADIIRQLSDGADLTGKVRLGVTELVGLTWLVRLIKQTKQYYPSIDLVPHIDAGLTLHDNLAKGLLDLAVLPGPFWGPEFDSIHVGSVVNAWMASPKLGLDFEAKLTGNDLDRFQVITQPTDSALTHLYGAWFAEQDIRVNHVLTCNNLGIIAQLTVLGMGISYLPKMYFSHLKARGDLGILNVQPPLPDIHYYVIHRQGVLDPLLSLIVDLIHETCDFERPGVALLAPDDFAGTESVSAGSM